MMEEVFYLVLLDLDKDGKTKQIERILINDDRPFNK